MLFLFACSQDKQAEQNKPDIKRPVKVTQLTLVNEALTRTLPGEVTAANRAVMSFQVNGAIAEILVRPGQEVKTGDVLAKLDNALYEQQSEIAKAEYNLAKVLYQRAEELVKRGVISRNDFDKNKQDFTVAQAALDLASNNLAYTELIAPYDSIVSARYKEAFEYVQAKEPVLAIQTESQIDVSFQLPEQYIGIYQNSPNQGDVEKISYGQVNVKFDSREQWYPAHITELSTLADNTTGSYTVVLRLPTPDKLNVFPGMSALVSISLPTQAESKLPKLPASAVINENGQTYVFRLLENEQKVEKVAVNLAEGRLVSGLTDGDLLVTAGANELTDGQTAVRWIKERGL
ncbi:efflux RND transporter periplasmic adaptor subunit [Motilimonas cestriensis]|uniref:Efflux RND transporter periplasmic adaptor subunit n=2 Tax=Motilimonas cestriensis TaxID=2742685 RepID=A0ABS8WE03_9GAMM|nr:efflux RND transporter periplasmic adaptor subunit [Motilimonas cestriensis]